MKNNFITQFTLGTLKKDKKDYTIVLDISLMSDTRKERYSFENPTEVIENFNELNISATAYSGKKTNNFEFGGQILSFIEENKEKIQFSKGVDLKTLEKVLKYWKEIHINGSILGTEKQMEEINKNLRLNGFEHFTKKECYEHLKMVELEVDQEHVFGSKKLYKQILPEDLEKIKKIIVKFNDINEIIKKEKGKKFSDNMVTL